MRWLLCALLILGSVRAADWPQFLGPTRDGVYAGPPIARDWDARPLDTLWKVTVGQGFSAPIVSDGKVLLFQRKNDDEVLVCYDAATGKVLWQSRYRSTYSDDFGFDEGPRATPCVSNGSVFTLGADGVIQAVRISDGKQLWSINAREKFAAGKGFFGFACSPLVYRDLLILNIGGKDAGIVALDTATGGLKWKATDHEASYSSPVVASFGGKDTALFFTRNGLVAVEPTAGGVLAEFPWRPRANASVNAATPLVISNSVFISTSYDTGAVLLDWNNGRFTKRWAADNRLSNHYATSVYHDGHLYGFDGRQEFGMAFTCVEAATGKAKWRQERFGAGTVTLMKNDGLLLILKESGELVLVRATAERWNLLTQTQILGSTTRAYPALANGVLYARDKNNLIAVGLSASDAR